MNVSNFLKHNPEIARAFELYCEGRLQDLFSVELPKGKSSSVHIMSHTTGYGHLPVEGGLLDQPYRLMAFWTYFREGDQIATSKSLKS